MARNRPLTGKQLAFAQAFLEMGSKANAYRQAYNCGRMSPETIRAKAGELSVVPEVAVKIEELQAAAAKRNEVTVDRVIQEYVIMAYFRIGDFCEFTPDGAMIVDWEGLMRSEANGAIRSLTQEEYTTGTGKSARTVRKTKVTFHPKNEALRDLGRHLGLFPKDGALLPSERFQIILNLGGDKGNKSQTPNKRAPRKVEGKME